MTLIRNFTIALSATALLASISFAQFPGHGGGGPGGPGNGPGGWKHKQWGDQWGNDNSPWNDKQTMRLKRMSKEITEAIDDNSDFLNPMEQFEIARRLRDLKAYIDQVTPNQPPPFGPPGPGPGPGPGGNMNVVGQTPKPAPVSNAPNGGWIEVKLNQVTPVDALRIVAIPAPGFPMGPKAHVQIHQLSAAYGNSGVPVLGNQHPFIVVPGQPVPPFPFSTGQAYVDSVWIRAEAMKGKFFLNVTVLNKSGFGGGPGHFGGPGGGPGGGFLKPGPGHHGNFNGQNSQ